MKFLEFSDHVASDFTEVRLTVQFKKARKKGDRSITRKYLMPVEM